MLEENISKFDPNKKNKAQREEDRTDEPKVVGETFAAKLEEREQRERNMLTGKLAELFPIGPSDLPTEEESEDLSAAFTMVAKTFSPEGPTDEDKLKFNRAMRRHDRRMQGIPETKPTKPGKVIPLPIKSTKD